MDSFQGPTTPRTSARARARAHRPRPPSPDPSLASRETKPARRCRRGCRVSTVGLVPTDIPNGYELTSNGLQEQVDLVVSVSVWSRGRWLHLLPIGGGGEGGISSDLDEGQGKQDCSFSFTQSRELAVCSLACLEYAITLDQPA